ncbi:MAG: hypothetical protein FWC21_04730 [Treponema sp.]|nr:hypothetical protein [Treponema sp.]
MSSKKLEKIIQELKITKAYAEFKVMAGDLGPEYDNWIYNIEKTIETLKTKK